MCLSSGFVRTDRTEIDREGGRDGVRESDSETYRETDRDRQRQMGNWQTHGAKDGATSDRRKQSDRHTDTDVSLSLHCLLCFVVVVVAFLFVVSHIYFVLLYLSVSFDHLLILPPNYLSLPTGS